MILLYEKLSFLLQLYGLFIQVGSPTAFADKELEKSLPVAAVNHGLYIPSGAFWGGEDIKKMADRGTLQVTALRIVDY